MAKFTTTIETNTLLILFKTALLASDTLKNDEKYVTFKFSGSRRSITFFADSIDNTKDKDYFKAVSYCEYDYYDIDNIGCKITIEQIKEVLDVLEGRTIDKSVAMVYINKRDLVKNEPLEIEYLYNQ